MLLSADPFRELDRMAQRLAGNGRFSSVMPMDAYREGDTYVIHFDLPGVSSEAINLEVERNVLTVSATRNTPADDRNAVIAERPTGHASRRLVLGDSLATESIEASYDQGVLTLRIPVAQQAKPRKISVSEAPEREAELVS